MKNKIIYISGKYSGKDFMEISGNIKKARQMAVSVWELDLIALTPHLNTFHFEIDCKCKYNDYMQGDLFLLARCDAILMLDNWRDSEGAKIEHDFAHKIGIPVFYSLDELKIYKERLCD